MQSLLRMRSCGSKLMLRKLIPRDATALRFTLLSETKQSVGGFNYPFLNFFRFTILPEIFDFFL
jgi:hypothetical protein